ncbi:DNA-binding MarR family transcriptional regulator [Actinomycetospora succinea]|uniref:DNA-binding MarR family transcriptional regulator n=1 Tax=Actinomycetospora succinea TaxID=663603 RepID=A0A4R6VN93_9PSEU|nr:MarR family transcriptional regulator [Actinomycetospora succinea]TDQ65463.1 DNA-binding MarR family transcriptional regulator [Actinomycetospora succinea]
MSTGPRPASAAFLLMALGRRVREEVEGALKDEGIAMRHLSALGHLAPHPGLSYSELARRAGVTPQSMQSTLAALEARGAVARDTDPGRGRTAELHVTTEGARLRRVGTDIITGIDERLRARLDDATYGTLTEALSTLFREDP